MSLEKEKKIEKHERELVASILASKSERSVVATTLETDQRVIARVTDGIYRQPGSALRELISNAYDADATQVVVHTDLPRFDRISVEDNGCGMSPEALARMLLHIGGSAKRTGLGADLGVTASGDPTRSPGGRKLIGKIGIGLFSVSQLTHSFQIITKVKGDAFRTIATVALKQYSDDTLASQPEGEDRFEAGKVNIWRERARDTASQGTTIVLTHIRPQARDTLRSRDIWAAIEHNEQTRAEDERQDLSPPLFHIGRVDKTGATRIKTKGRFDTLPWSEGDSGRIAFRKLVGAVWDQVNAGNPNPRLERIFDYYLQMVWQLSLAVPLRYVAGHPYDKDGAEWTAAYRLSNQGRGNAEQVDLKRGRAIRTTCGLTDPLDDAGAFTVSVDDLELRRPILFEGLPATHHAITKPMVFVGACREQFSKHPTELSGGPLSFEAYLFWTPKVAPTEHQGALIRIHGSSGTLFDPTFLRYQVSEQTRLRQIVCEIFVSEGLESALNIDRESFNSAHPHMVFLTKWLHGALRQLATTQKKVAAGIRERERGKATTKTKSKVQGVATATWRRETEDADAEPPEVKFTAERKPEDVRGPSYVFDREAVFGDRVAVRTAGARARAAVLEEKLKAIAQVLSSFGVFEDLSQAQQERMLRAIREILELSEE